jgi:hypothetical protein
MANADIVTKIAYDFPSRKLSTIISQLEEIHLENKYRKTIP